MKKFFSFLNSHFLSTRTLSETKLLHAMIMGSSLKSQRDMAGQKVYHLVSLEGNIVTVDKDHVDSLKRQGLIVGNHKFPGATYLLTAKGRNIAATLTATLNEPLHARVER